MKTPTTNHQPLGVFPDVVPEKHTPEMAKRAKNMRLNPTPPSGGQSRVRVPGNEEVSNQWLPQTGTNWNVGPTKNNVTGQQYSFNYNSGGLHGVYRFTEPDVWEVIDEGSHLNFKQRQDPLAADYVKDYVVNSLYHVSGLLLYQDGINEDRAINVERGIRTQNGESDDVYQLPMQDWVLAQLHRRPAFPPQIFGINATASTVTTYIGETLPKPITDIVKRTIQFGMNYGYMDNVESGICEASIVNWNDGPYLIVADEEFYDYIGNGSKSASTPPTEPNPYIKYVKFYYRSGNTNDWILFNKTLNIKSNWLTGLDGLTTPAIPAGYHFGILLPKMSDLQNIGGISAAALNGIDALGRSSKGTAYGDSRLLKWDIKFGYTLEFPTATIAIATDQVTSLIQRNYRTHLPFPNQVELAFELVNDRSVAIAQKVLPIVSAGRTTAWKRACDDIWAITPSFDFTIATWKEIVDYFFNNPSGSFPQTYKFSQSDINFFQTITITPTADVLLDENVSTIRLLTKVQNTCTFFLRTQSRSYWIYKNISGEFVLVNSTLIGKVYLPGTADQLTFYGIGFSFNSGEPINYSVEANYHVRVLGHLTASANIIENESLGLGFSGKEFKIDGQKGTVLISKQEWSKLPFQLPNSMIETIGLFDPGPYLQWILDVAIYSKQETKPITYARVASVEWSREEWLALTPKKYYGDVFIPQDEIVMNDEIARIDRDGTMVDYFDATTITWRGYFSSMNLNGIQLQDWDQDIGNFTAIDSEPKEEVLSTGMIHGEQYLLGSKINNMFVFNPLNKSQVTGDIGNLIMVLIIATGSGTGDNIYCLCTGGSEVRFLGKIQQTASNGQQVMSLSTNVFGNENTQPWRVGLQSQMEVVNTGEGQVFHFDRVKKVSMQITLGGQDPISIEQFQVTDMETMEGPGVMGYDPLNNEFIYATAESGFAYNRLTKKYQGFRTHGINNKTESFSFGASEGIGKIFYGWSKGKMYRYNAPGNTQTINGEPYQASITVISAPAVDKLKNFASVRYFSLAGQVWKAFVRSANGRQVTIPLDEFENYATYFKAAIMCDENSEGGKVDGDVLNGPWIEVEIMDEDNTPKDLNFIEVGFTPSLAQ